MEDTKSKKEILAIIDAELQGNLMILIDPKQKDSFSQMRINTWKDTVKERLYYHLIENKQVMTKLEAKQKQELHYLKLS
jgi:hypothetical protein